MYRRKTSRMDPNWNLLENVIKWVSMHKGRITQKFSKENNFFVSICRTDTAVKIDLH